MDQIHLKHVECVHPRERCFFDRKGEEGTSRVCLFVAVRRSLVILWQERGSPLGGGIILLCFCYLSLQNYYST